MARIEIPVERGEYLELQTVLANELLRAAQRAELVASERAATPDEVEQGLLRIVRVGGSAADLDYLVTCLPPYVRYRVFCETAEEYQELRSLSGIYDLIGPNGETPATEAQQRREAEWAQTEALFGQPGPR